jgi:hypothetical protein
MAMEGNDRKQGALYRPWLFGVPVWAWLSGMATGLVFGLLVFDNWVVKILFALSIGTAFALAFGQGGKQKR